MKIVAAIDRIEEELGSGDYLVGDAFSVADLAAASLLYPIVAPADGPVERRGPLQGHRSASASRSWSADGFKWVGEMFARHREPARAAAAA